MKKTIYLCSVSQVALIFLIRPLRTSWPTGGAAEEDLSLRFMKAE